MDQIAIFADVHSDLGALQTVLDAAGRAGCSRVWCLGDFLGGPHDQAVEVFDLVMNRCERNRVLAGNHETFITDEVFRWLGGGWADLAYDAAQSLGPQRRKQLAALRPHMVAPELGVELTHGSLTDYSFGFVATPQAASETMARAQAPLVLCGHTHEAAWFDMQPGLADGRVAIERVIEVDVEYELPPARRACLNPGAACDARGARWMELQLEGDKRVVLWHQTEKTPQD